MFIDRLQISNIRNLAQTEIYPSPTLNFITGGNGSGKSALIEAISLITSARSFRTRNSSKIVNSSHSSFTIFARIRSGLSQYGVGLKRDNTLKDFQIRVNQERVHSSSTLATYFPQITISPERCDLIDGSPERRRSFIDWSLFHVKHDYNKILSNYRRSLAQRNNLLRGGDLSQLDHWDSVMSQYAEQINRYRSDLFGEILAVLKGVISQRFSLNIDLNRLDILFSSGWRRGESLISALKTGREIDIDRGFTHSGPHRADFRITMDGAPVKEYLSRGEKKLLQILLTVSQLIHFRGEREFDPIVLMDDIFAELDQQNIGLLFALVRDLGLQLFVTATDSVEVGQYIEKGEKLFHVKQGIFTEPLQ